MAKRRVVVGAIGGDKQRDHALRFGEAAARAGLVVLTGGGNEVDGEVKNAAIEGARYIEDSARYIGILADHKNGQVTWERSDKGLLLYTGLPHYVRNLINGLTPDVLVVFGGSRGTLAEAAFAEAAGKPLFFFGDGIKGPAVARLRINYLDCFVNDTKGDVQKFLEEPLKVFPEFAGKRWTALELMQALRRRLAMAQDWGGDAGALVEQCIAASIARGELGPTGFPGLPSDPASKQRFEAVIEEISG
jgi:predicted Rossmann-fold nucleotide-binding protein